MHGSKVPTSTKAKANTKPQQTKTKQQTQPKKSKKDNKKQAKSKSIDELAVGGSEQQAAGLATTNTNQYGITQGQVGKQQPPSQRQSLTKQVKRANSQLHVPELPSTNRLHKEFVSQSTQSFTSSPFHYHQIPPKHADMILMDDKKARRHEEEMIDYIDSPLLRVTDPVLRETIRQVENRSLKEDQQRNLKINKHLMSTLTSNAKIKALIKEGASNKTILNAMYNLLPRILPTRSLRHNVDSLDWLGSVRHRWQNEVEPNGYDVEDTSDADTLPQQRAFTRDEMNRILQDVEESKYIESDVEEALFAPTAALGDLRREIQQAEIDRQVRFVLKHVHTDGIAPDRFDYKTMRSEFKKLLGAPLKRRDPADTLRAGLRHNDNDAQLKEFKAQLNVEKGTPNQLSVTLEQAILSERERRKEVLGAPYLPGSDIGSLDAEDFLLPGTVTNAGLGLMPPMFDVLQLPIHYMHDEGEKDDKIDIYGDALRPFQTRFDIACAVVLNKIMGPIGEDIPTYLNDSVPAEVRLYSHPAFQKAQLAILKDLKSGTKTAIDSLRVLMSEGFHPQDVMKRLVGQLDAIFANEHSPIELLHFDHQGNYVEDAEVAAVTFVGEEIDRLHEYGEFIRESMKTAQIINVTDKFSQTPSTPIALDQTQPHGTLRSQLPSTQDGSLPTNLQSTSMSNATFETYRIQVDAEGNTIDFPFVRTDNHPEGMMLRHGLQSQEDGIGNVHRLTAQEIDLSNNLQIATTEPLSSPFGFRPNQKTIYGKQMIQFETEESQLGGLASREVPATRFTTDGTEISLDPHRATEYTPNQMIGALENYHEHLKPRIRREQMIANESAVMFQPEMSGLSDLLEYTIRLDPGAPNNRELSEDSDNEHHMPRGNSTDDTSEPEYIHSGAEVDPKQLFGVPFNDTTVQRTKQQMARMALYGQQNTNDLQNESGEDYISEGDKQTRDSSDDSHQSTIDENEMSLTEIDNLTERDVDGTYANTKGNYKPRQYRHNKNGEINEDPTFAFQGTFSDLETPELTPHKFVEKELIEEQKIKFQRDLLTNEENRIADINWAPITNFDVNVSKFALNKLQPVVDSKEVQFRKYCQEAGLALTEYPSEFNDLIRRVFDGDIRHQLTKAARAMTREEQIAALAPIFNDWRKVLQEDRHRLLHPTGYESYEHRQKRIEHASNFKDRFEIAKAQMFFTHDNDRFGNLDNVGYGAVAYADAASTHPDLITESDKVALDEFFNSNRKIAKDNTTPSSLIPTNAIATTNGQSPSLTISAPKVTFDNVFGSNESITAGIVPSASTSLKKRTRSKYTLVDLFEGKVKLGEGSHAPAITDFDFRSHYLNKVTADVEQFNAKYYTQKQYDTFDALLQDVPNHETLSVTAKKILRAKTQLSNGKFIHFKRNDVAYAPEDIDADGNEIKIKSLGVADVNEKLDESLLESIQRHHRVMLLSTPNPQQYSFDINSYINTLEQTGDKDKALRAAEQIADVIPDEALTKQLKRYLQAWKQRDLEAATISTPIHDHSRPTQVGDNIDAAIQDNMNQRVQKEIDMKLEHLVADDILRTYGRLLIGLPAKNRGIMQETFDTYTAQGKPLPAHLAQNPIFGEAYRQFQIDNLIDPHVDKIDVIETEAQTKERESMGEEKIDIFSQPDQGLGYKLSFRTPNKVYQATMDLQVDGDDMDRLRSQLSKDVLDPQHEKNIDDRVEWFQEPELLQAFDRKLMLKAVENTITKDPFLSYMDHIPKGLKDAEVLRSSFSMIPPRLLDEAIKSREGDESAMTGRRRNAIRYNPAFSLTQLRRFRKGLEKYSGIPFYLLDFAEVAFNPHRPFFVHASKEENHLREMMTEERLRQPSKSLLVERPDDSDNDTPSIATPITIGGIPANRQAAHVQHHYASVIGTPRYQRIQQFKKDLSKRLQKETYELSSSEYDMEELDIISDMFQKSLDKVLDPEATAFLSEDYDMDALSAEYKHEMVKYSQLGNAQKQLNKMQDEKADPVRIRRDQNGNLLETTQRVTYRNGLTSVVDSSDAEEMFRLRQEQAFEENPQLKEQSDARRAASRKKLDLGPDINASDLEQPELTRQEAKELFSGDEDGSSYEQQGDGPNSLQKYPDRANSDDYEMAFDPYGNIANDQAIANRSHYDRGKDAFALNDFFASLMPYLQEQDDRDDGVVFMKNFAQRVQAVKDAKLILFDDRMKLTPMVHDPAGLKDQEGYHDFFDNENEIVIPGRKRQALRVIVEGWLRYKNRVERGELDANEEYQPHEYEIGWAFERIYGPLYFDTDEERAAARQEYRDFIASTRTTQENVPEDIQSASEDDRIQNNTKTEPEDDGITMVMSDDVDEHGNVSKTAQKRKVTRKFDADIARTVGYTTKGYDVDEKIIAAAANQRVRQELNANGQIVNGEDGNQNVEVDYGSDIDDNEYHLNAMLDEYTGLLEERPRPITQDRFEVTNTLNHPIWNDQTLFDNQNPFFTEKRHHIMQRLQDGLGINDIYDGLTKDEKIQFLLDLLDQRQQRQMKAARRDDIVSTVYGTQRQLLRKLSDELQLVKRAERTCFKRIFALDPQYARQLVSRQLLYATNRRHADDDQDLPVHINWKVELNYVEEIMWSAANRLNARTGGQFPGAPNISKAHDKTNFTPPALLTGEFAPMFIDQHMVSSEDEFENRFSRLRHHANADFIACGTMQWREDAQKNQSTKNLWNMNDDTKAVFNSRPVVDDLMAQTAKLQIQEDFSNYDFTSDVEMELIETNLAQVNLDTTTNLAFASAIQQHRHKLDQKRIEMEKVNPLMYGEYDPTIDYRIGDFFAAGSGRIQRTENGDVVNDSYAKTRQRLKKLMRSKKELNLVETSPWENLHASLEIPDDNGESVNNFIKSLAKIVERMQRTNPLTPGNALGADSNDIKQLVHVTPEDVSKFTRDEISATNLPLEPVNEELFTADMYAMTTGKKVTQTFETALQMKSKTTTDILDNEIPIETRFIPRRNGSIDVDAAIKADPELKDAILAQQAMDRYLGANTLLQANALAIRYADGFDENNTPFLSEIGTNLLSQANIDQIVYQVLGGKGGAPIYPTTDEYIEPFVRSPHEILGELLPQRAIKGVKNPSNLHRPQLYNLGRSTKQEQDDLKAIEDGEMTEWTDYEQFEYGEDENVIKTDKSIPAYIRYAKAIKAYDLTTRSKWLPFLPLYDDDIIAKDPKTGLVGIEEFTPHPLIDAKEVPAVENNEFQPKTYISKMLNSKFKLPADKMPTPRIFITQENPIVTNILNDPTIEKNQSQLQAIQQLYDDMETKFDAFDDIEMEWAPGGNVQPPRPLQVPDHATDFDIEALRKFDDARVLRPQFQFLRKSIRDQLQQQLPIWMKVATKEGNYVHTWVENGELHTKLNPNHPVITPEVAHTSEPLPTGMDEITATNQLRPDNVKSKIVTLRRNKYITAQEAIAMGIDPNTYESELTKLQQNYLQERLQQFFGATHYRYDPSFTSKKYVQSLLMYTGLRKLETDPQIGKNLFEQMKIGADVINEEVLYPHLNVQSFYKFVRQIEKEDKLQRLGLLDTYYNKLDENLEYEQLQDPAHNPLLQLGKDTNKQSPLLGLIRDIVNHAEIFEKINAQNLTTVEQVDALTAKPPTYNPLKTIRKFDKHTRLEEEYSANESDFENTFPVEVNTHNLQTKPSTENVYNQIHDALLTTKKSLNGLSIEEVEQIFLTADKQPEPIRGVLIDLLRTYLEQYPQNYITAPSLHVKPTNPEIGNYNADHTAHPLRNELIMNANKPTLLDSAKPRAIFALEEIDLSLVDLKQRFNSEYSSNTIPQEDLTLFNTIILKSLEESTVYYPKPQLTEIQVENNGADPTQGIIGFDSENLTIGQLAQYKPEDLRFSTDSVSVATFNKIMSLPTEKLITFMNYVDYINLHSKVIAERSFYSTLMKDIRAVRPIPDTSVIDTIDAQRVREMYKNKTQFDKYIIGPNGYIRLHDDKAGDDDALMSVVRRSKFGRMRGVDEIEHRPHENGTQTGNPAYNFRAFETDEELYDPITKEIAKDHYRDILHNQPADIATDLGDLESDYPADNEIMESPNNADRPEDTDLSRRFRNMQEWMSDPLSPRQIKVMKQLYEERKLEAFWNGTLSPFDNAEVYQNLRMADGATGADTYLDHDRELARLHREIVVGVVREIMDDQDLELNSLEYDSYNLEPDFLPQYTHFDHINVFAARRFSPYTTLPLSESNIPPMIGIEQQRNIYNLHLLDPITFHPRWLARRLNISYAQCIAILKIYDFRHKINLSESLMGTDVEYDDAVDGVDDVPINPDFANTDIQLPNPPEIQLTQFDEEYLYSRFAPNLIGRVSWVKDREREIERTDYGFRHSFGFQDMFGGDGMAKLVDQLETTLTKRYMEEEQILDALEQAAFARFGPIHYGTTKNSDLHKPPKLPREIISSSLHPPIRNNWALTTLDEARKATYGIMIRDRDGYLRHPTYREFKNIRLREKDRRTPFFWRRHHVLGKLPEISSLFIDQVTAIKQDFDSKSNLVKDMRSTYDLNYIRQIEHTPLANVEDVNYKGESSQDSDNFDFHWEQLQFNKEKVSRHDDTTLRARDWLGEYDNTQMKLGKEYSLANLTDAENDLVRQSYDIDARTKLQFEGERGLTPLERRMRQKLRSVMSKRFKPDNLDERMDDDIEFSEKDIYQDKDTGRIHLTESGKIKQEQMIAQRSKIKWSSEIIKAHEADQQQNGQNGTNPIQDDDESTEFNFMEAFDEEELDELDIPLPPKIDHDPEQSIPDDYDEFFEQAEGSEVDDWVMGDRKVRAKISNRILMRHLQKRQPKMVKGLPMFQNYTEADEYNNHQQDYKDATTIKNILRQRAIETGDYSQYPQSEPEANLRKHGQPTITRPDPVLHALRQVQTGVKPTAEMFHYQRILSRYRELDPNPWMTPEPTDNISGTELSDDRSTTSDVENIDIRNIKGRRFAKHRYSEGDGIDNVGDDHTYDKGTNDTAQPAEAPAEGAEEVAKVAADDIPVELDENGQPIKQQDVASSNDSLTSLSDKSSSDETEFNPSKYDYKGDEISESATVDTDEYSTSADEFGNGYGKMFTPDLIQFYKGLKHDSKKIVRLQKKAYQIELHTSEEDEMNAKTRKENGDGQSSDDITDSTDLSINELDENGQPIASEELSQSSSSSSRSSSQSSGYSNSSISIEDDIGVESVLGPNAPEPHAPIKIKSKARNIVKASEYHAQSKLPKSHARKLKQIALEKEIFGSDIENLSKQDPATVAAKLRIAKLISPTSIQDMRSTELDGSENPSDVAHFSERSEELSQDSIDRLQLKIAKLSKEDPEYAYLKYQEAMENNRPLDPMFNSTFYQRGNNGDTQLPRGITTDNMKHYLDSGEEELEHYANGGKGWERPNYISAVKPIRTPFGPMFINYNEDVHDVIHPRDYSSSDGQLPPTFDELKELMHNLNDPIAKGYENDYLSLTDTTVDEDNLLLKKIQGELEQEEIEDELDIDQQPNTPISSTQSQTANATNGYSNNTLNVMKKHDDVTKIEGQGQGLTDLTDTQSSFDSDVHTQSTEVDEKGKKIKSHYRFPRNKMQLLPTSSGTTDSDLDHIRDLSSQSDSTPDTLFKVKGMKYKGVHNRDVSEDPYFDAEHNNIDMYQEVYGVPRDRITPVQHEFIQDVRETMNTMRANKLTSLAKSVRDGQQTKYKTLRKALYDPQQEIIQAGVITRIPTAYRDVNTNYQADENDPDLKEYLKNIDLVYTTKPQSTTAAPATTANKQQKNH